jgi:hypothetical protein
MERRKIEAYISGIKVVFGTLEIGKGAAAYRETSTNTGCPWMVKRLELNEICEEGCTNLMLGRTWSIVKKDSIYSIPYLYNT